MSGNVTIAVDDVDAEDRENLTRFFRDVVDMTKGRAITYADILVKKGIGSPEKLKKRVLKNERYLIDAGINEEDAEEILEALKRDDLPELLALPPKIRRNTSAESQPSSQSISVKESGPAVKSHVLDIQKFTQVIRELGRGGMGVAYQCIYAESEVAVKAVTSDKYREGFLEEIQVQSRLNHPNLVSVIGVVKANITCSPAAPLRYEIIPDERNYMLVAQYCSGGSLREFLKQIRTKQRSFDEALCLRIVHEIAMGMAFLHDGKIIHMDLKPGNIFLTEHFQALVGDFGLATEVNVQMTVANTLDSMMTGFVNFKGGTLYYLPPECFTVHKMTKAADVYAYGVILHNVFVTQDEDLTYDVKEVLCGEIPTKFNAMLVEKVCAGHRPNLPFRGNVKLSVETQQKVYDLMTRCWAEAPKERPKFETIAKELREFREHVKNRTPTPTSAFGNGNNNIFSPTAFGSRAPSPAPLLGPAQQQHQITIPLHNKPAVDALQFDSQQAEPPIKAGLNLPSNRHFISSAEGKSCGMCNTHKPTKEGVLCPIDPSHFICRSCLPVHLTQQEDIFSSSNSLLFMSPNTTNNAYLRFDHRIFCSFCATTSLPPRLTALPLTQIVSCLGMEAVQEYLSLERELLFRCGNCHSVRSLDVLTSGNISDEMDDIAVYNQLERYLIDPATGVSRFQEFVDQLSAFVMDELSLEDFYQSLYTTFFPELKVYSDDESWRRMKTILHFLAARAEKRCALQLRYYTDRPRIKTTCCCDIEGDYDAHESSNNSCFNEHCFICQQSNGFHDGRSCIEVSGSKCPDVVRCLNCAKAIITDGNDTFTCSCGTVFNWMELMERCDGCAAFYASHPENTIYEAALSLCNPNTEETELRQAKAIFKRHPIEVSRALRLWLRRKHSSYPSQFCAVCYDENDISLSAGLPEGVQEAMRLWRLENKQSIAKCEEQNDLAVKSLFPSLYQSNSSDPQHDGEFSIAAYNLLSYDGNYLYNHFVDDENQMRLRASAQQWKESHLSQYNRDVAGYEIRQAKRFLSSFKHVPWHKLRPVKHGFYFSSTCFNSTVSDENLRFEDGNLIVERPGSVSCYPAAFADLAADHAFITIEVVNSSATVNFFTFGIAMRPNNSSTIIAMAKSNSDGVGRSPDTWGLVDDREKKAEGAIFAASGFQVGFMPRKLKNGDRITAVANTQAGWMIITVVDCDGSEKFEQRFAIPQGSCTKYHWAMTLANDFKVKMIVNPLSMRYDSEDDDGNNNAADDEVTTINAVRLNENQTKMWNSFQRALSALYRREQAVSDGIIAAEEDLQLLLEFVEKELLVSDSVFEAKFEGSKRQAFNAFEGIMPWLEQTVLHLPLEAEGGKQTADDSAIDIHTMSAQGVLEAVSWYHTNRGYFLQQQQQIMAQTFALMSGGSQGAPSIAALTLYDYYETVANGKIKPSDQQKMALAYMKCNSAAMHAWYDREKHQPDPFVPNIAGNCRCLPRHTGSSCSASSSS